MTQFVTLTIDQDIHRLVLEYAVDTKTTPTKAYTHLVAAGLSRWIAERELRTASKIMQGE